MNDGKVWSVSQTDIVIRAMVSERAHQIPMGIPISRQSSVATKTR